MEFQSKGNARVMWVYPETDFEVFWILDRFELDEEETYKVKHDRSVYEKGCLVFEKCYESPNYPENWDVQ